MGSPTNDFFSDLLNRRIGNWVEFAVASRQITQDSERGILAGRQHGASVLKARADIVEVACTAMYGAKVAESENRGGAFGTQILLNDRLNDALMLGLIPYQFAQSARAVTGIKELADKAGKVVRHFKEQEIVMRRFDARSLALPRAETIIELIVEATGKPVPPYVMKTVELTLEQIAIR